MSIHICYKYTAIPPTAENITLRCLTNCCHVEFPFLLADSLFLCFRSSLKIVSVSNKTIQYLSVAVQVNIPICAKVGEDSGLNES